MFHKIKSVHTAGLRLSVQFAEGITKIYDVKPLFTKWAPFQALKTIPNCLVTYQSMWAAMELSGMMIWIYPNELFENGKPLKPVWPLGDGLQADACTATVGSERKARCAKLFLCQVWYKLLTVAWMLGSKARQTVGYFW